MIKGFHKKNSGREKFTFLSVFSLIENTYTFSTYKYVLKVYFHEVTKVYLEYAYSIFEVHNVYFTDYTFCMLKVYIK